MVSIFKRRKWVFIITFLIILVIGFLYTFLKTPFYESSSRLQLSGIYYNDDLLKYYPDDAGNIEVYPSNLKSEELEITILGDYSKALRNDELLNYVAENINDGITGADISSLTDILLDYSNNTIFVRVRGDSPEKANVANGLIVNTFINNRRIEKEDSFNAIISKIDSELEKLDASIEGDVNSSGNPDTKLYQDLTAIKYNLTNNKDYIINNIKIVQEPSFSEKAININRTKEILVVILLAVLAGLIAIFLPSTFLPVKTKNE